MQFKQNKWKYNKGVIKLTSIKEKREAYKTDEGFEFPEYFEKYQNAVATLWRPQEVSMSSDVRAWGHATPEEKTLIGGLLKGFTQFECIVGDYWSDDVAQMFPKPEILSMVRAYSLQECIHQEAYNHLSDTLGINEFQAFLGDPVAQKKLKQFYNYSNSGKVTLGVFSGAGEGVSLFSSFAILLSFSLSGRFKGLAQIISWSQIDEQTHSDSGCSLFRQLVREEGITFEEKVEIFNGFNAVLDNELHFLQNAFQGRDKTINGLNIEIMEHYMRSRANNRLRALGIYDEKDFFYEYEPALAFKVSEWFDPLSTGSISHDFFALTKEGSSYVAKPTYNWELVNIGKISLEYR